MVRSLLCSLVALGLCAAVPAAENKNAKDTKNPPKQAKKAKDNKHRQEAKITKVDAKNGTVTVRMKGKDGKDHERTFRLAEDIRYFDSTGRVAAIDLFQSGNDVLVVEREGKVVEMRQHDKNKSGAEKANSGTEKQSGKKKSGQQ